MLFLGCAAAGAYLIQYEFVKIGLFIGGVGLSALKTRAMQTENTKRSARGIVPPSPMRMSETK